MFSRLGNVIGISGYLIVRFVRDLGVGDQGELVDRSVT